MDKQEYSKSLSELDRRQSMRELDAEFGIIFKQEEIDPLEIVEVMSESYMGLANGIHENVQAWSSGRGPLLQKVVTPTVYINGQVAGTKTEYLLTSYNFDNREKQPEYVENYIKARDAAYYELLQHAVDHDDYEPLLNVITTYKESTLAKRLLRELRARKESYPDMIIGNADLVLSRISSQNQHIESVKKSSRKYALETARQEFDAHIRKELNDEETGVLKAAVLGVRLKFGRPRSERKWMQIILEEQLMRIANYPSVPEQLIAKEKQGLPVPDTDANFE